MKRHGTYTIVFNNEKWTVFKAQGGINQVLVKDKTLEENHAFARYDHKPEIFAEDGTPYNWLPAYIKARVAKALNTCETLEVGKTIICAY